MSRIALSIPAAATARLLAVAILAPSVGAWAQEAMVLKPGFRPGSASLVRIETEVDMKLPMGGGPADQKLRMEYRVSREVDWHEDAKSKIVEVTVDSVSTEMSMPGMQMRYDSTDPASRDALLGAAFRPLIDNAIQLVYDENDAFVKMDNTDAFAGMGEAPFGQQIGPEQIRQFARSALEGGLSDHPVRPGDTWTQQLEIPFPGMGPLGFTVQYIYRKDVSVKGSAHALIEFEGTIAGRDGAQGEESEEGLEARERRADEGVQEGTLRGKIALDKTILMVSDSELTMNLKLMMPSSLGVDEEIELPIVQVVRISLLSYRAP
ncbi:MAG: hypothetical protein ACC661_09345 [Verrucomicrobiales bacterium]